MKFVSWLFKLIATILLFAFVITLPVALLFRNASDVLFDEDAMFSLVDSNFLAPEFLASVGQETVKERSVSPVPYENAVDELVINGLSNLSEAEWLGLAELLAPADIVSTSLAQVLTGFYTWLDSPDPQPSFLVDLKPWKSTITKNALPVFELVLDGLDQCSAQQLEAYDVLGDITEETEEIPLCRPPEPYYSMLLDVAATQMPEIVSQWPNIVDLSDQFTGEEGLGFDPAKASLRQTRENAPVAWVPLMVLFVLAIPMGARSVSDMFKWVGWPLLIAGIFTLILGMGLMFMTEGAIAAAGMDDVAAPMHATVVAIVDHVSRPTLTQGVGMIVIAIIAMVIGSVLRVIISGEDKAAEKTAADMSTLQAHSMQQTEQTPAEPVAYSSATHPYQQPPKDALEALEEIDDDGSEDDDSRPTGMFG